MALQNAQNAQNNRTMTEVLQDIVANIQEIFRSEFKLAKTEIREQAAKAAKSSAPLGSGIVLSLYAFGFILLAIVYALEIVVAAWLAALIVGVAVAVVAAIMISVGRKRLKQVRMPEKTIVSVKENVQWAKNQIS
jgi:uncharacterized membrane protein YqjE